MSDSELCDLIAEVWVDNGGDVDGIDYCIGMIRESIKKEIISRSETVV